MRDNTMRYCKGNVKNTAGGNSMPATTDTSRGGSPNLSTEAYDSTFVDSVLRLLKNVPKMVWVVGGGSLVVVVVVVVVLVVVVEKVVLLVTVLFKLRLSRERIVV